ncbi:MAG: methyltransferase [Marmoricola sp.]|jgi:SAM-dependent methyltransferase|nr:methyltransferase [Marmoricola sp.]
MAYPLASGAAKQLRGRERVDEQEIRKSAALEERHWWYAGRRDVVRERVRGLQPGRALDVGSGAGGNSAALAELGWSVTALEHSPAAAELAAARGLSVVRGDARALPFPDGVFDLVMSTDVWEHIDDDVAVAREAFRVCRPGGRLLVAVPAGMDLWSGHDVALGHVRRYAKDELVGRVEDAGFVVVDTMGWNVLLRPVARVRRSRSASEDESEMEEVHPLVNWGLRTVVRLEARLPLKRFRGISLMVRAYRPDR